jgi:cation diffusion facilitator family transporter
MTGIARLSDKRVVVTSLMVSLSDLTLNFIVALLTGSVVMLTQSLQGLSDGLTAVILLIGVNRAARESDKMHPFGYGREIFFWVLIAGLVMFLGTGMLSIVFGYRQFVEPAIIEKTWLAFAMLLFGFATNAYSLSKSIKRLNQNLGEERWWRRVMYSGMVETKATFLIDALGTTTAFLGIAALLSYTISGNIRFDGAGGILIGLTMMAGSLLLIRDVKGLIVGRAVSESTARGITDSALKVDGVLSVLDLRTMYVGSAKLLVILEVHLADQLSTDEIESITDAVKAAVIEHVPNIHRVQVEIETP